MRLAEFQIDRYGPLPRLQETCDAGITVFHGPNESGKTLLLESVLKLLDPAIDGHYGRMQRVDETPSGYVVVETADGEEKLGDGTTLPDISPVEAAHLRNIFTVRDSDLGLHDQHAFYDSLTEQIGDLHTSEIEAIREEFEERGRLTPKRRNLSNAEGDDKAKDVRNRAERVADGIGEYVEEAREENLDDLERQLLGAKRELRACRERLAAQERARTVAEHDRLRGRLEEYEGATAALDDRYSYSQDELERLNDYSRRLSSAASEIDEAEAEIEDREAEIAETEEVLAERQAELESLGRREERVASVESRLQRFREGRTDDGATGRWLRTTGRLALAGLVLGGVTAIAGAIGGSGFALVLSAVLLLVGVASSVGWLYEHRQVSSVEADRSALVEAARDAGFEVESVPEIAPAVEAYRGDLDAVESRIATLERDVEVARERIEDHEAAIGDATAERDECREEKRGVLREAGVDDVDAYRDALEATSDLEGERTRARQSLVDALGEPETTDPRPDDLIEYWEGTLAAMVADVDVDAVDPEEYDEDALDELERREEELESQTSSLERQLAEHRRAVRSFADDAHGIRTEPFLDESISLRSETIDGLEQLRRDLEALVARIERDAEISRVGLELFDEIHDEEEEKITDLFEGEGRATEVFGAITQGRYVDVTYDTDEEVLLVEDTDGRTFRPEELSHGTREQLFFATRVSLSEELLGGEPGFFILDDAFLPADRTRLEEGFEVLGALADDGWQIVYLTAKREVGVEMVESFDLACTQLDPLR